jgi:hypothetical protein
MLAQQLYNFLYIFPFLYVSLTGTSKLRNKIQSEGPQILRAPV